MKLAESILLHVLRIIGKALQFEYKNPAVEHALMIQIRFYNRASANNPVSMVQNDTLNRYSYRTVIIIIIIVCMLSA